MSGSGRRKTQYGFSLVTAIFILVVLATLGAAMVTFSTSQHATVAMDVQGARALQAARAGVEWGTFQVLQVANACPVSPATLNFTSAPLAGFTTTVSCSETVHPEGANTVRLFVLTATARMGTARTVNYIERQLSTRLARCVDAGGNPC